jgi:micrococcal nuclease
MRVEAAVTACAARSQRDRRRRRRHRAITVAVGVLVAGPLLAACGSGAGTAGVAGGGAGAPTAGGATVTRVVDGDTVAVRIAGRTEKVRLIGIDTPESVKPNTPVQCFAREASARTKALLPSGTAVRLERDVEQRDRYGRLLAYVYRASDGLFVNLTLAREGYAVPYTFPPNVAHARDFVAAADTARTQARGLWRSCGEDIPHHRLVPLPSPP